MPANATRSRSIPFSGARLSDRKEMRARRRTTFAAPGNCTDSENVYWIGQNAEFRIVDASLSFGVPAAMDSVWQMTLSARSVGSGIQSPG